MDKKIKKNEITLFAGRWKELETIMSSEINQSHKNKHFQFSLICGSWGKQNKMKNQGHERKRGNF
jgi:hypothetical protein